MTTDESARRELTRGVIYFHHGAKHSARLMVSAYSLRAAGYTGEIAILDTGSPDSPARKIASDPRVRASVVNIDAPPAARNAAYLAKASVWRSSPFDMSLFLDCDTLVMPGRGMEIAKSLRDLAEEAAPTAAFTAFSHWTTSGTQTMRNRIAGIRHDGVPHIAGLIKRCLENPFPAINTGVFWFHREAFCMNTWEWIASHLGRQFIVDELAAQLAAIDTDIEKLSRGAGLPKIATDRWNWSPIYGAAAKSDVVIAHFHGSKHVLHGDSGRGGTGERIWAPVWRQCFEANVAECRTAWPTGPAAGDRRLAARLDAILRGAEAGAA